MEALEYNSNNTEMKNTFKFLIFAFSFLLMGIASVAASVTYGEFTNAATSITVDTGQAASFDANVFSMHPPISIYIGLYDSAGTEVYNFYNSQYSSNGFSQRFSYTPTAAGSWDIIIQATDADGDASYSMLKLTAVTPTIPIIVTTNHAPVLSNIDDKTAVEDEEMKFSVSATDADSDAITYSISCSDDDVDVSDIEQDGDTFTWEPEDDGTFTFTVTASDGSLTDTETFDIEVEKADHQVTISSLSISKSEFYTGDILTVEIEVTNEGNIDEEDIVVSASIPTLGISTSTSAFDLDIDDDASKTLQMIIPSSAAKGAYSLKVTTGSDTSYQSFTIKEKATSVISTGTNETVTTVTQASGISTEMIIFSEVLIILAVCIIIWANKQRKLKVVSEFA